MVEKWQTQQARNPSHLQTKSSKTHQQSPKKIPKTICKTIKNNFIYIFILKKRLTSKNKSNYNNNKSKSKIKKRKLMK